MRTSILRASPAVLAATLFFAGCFPPFAHDGDGYDGETCDWQPDLIVDSFSLTTDDGPGTVLDFQDITLCNIGGGIADPGYTYQVVLAQTPDWSDTAWGVFESAPMVGVESWGCVSVELTVSVGGEPPEGYYYVIVDVDSWDEVEECDEDNNWTRTEDAVYIVPE